MKHATYKTHSCLYLGTAFCIGTAYEFVHQQQNGVHQILCTIINAVRTYVILCTKISMACTGYFVPT